MVLGRLVVFTRYPEPGLVKTRLVSSLGPDGAATLHRRLTDDTLAWARSLKAILTLEVHFDGGTIDAMSACFGHDLTYISQVDGDLGARLRAATATANCPTVVIGTDCPDLNACVVTNAFEALRIADLVLGPARDGGYYLIGLNQPTPKVFIDIPWGTDEVCRRTQEIAANSGLSVRLLDVLDDVDVPADLERFRRRSVQGEERHG